MIPPQGRILYITDKFGVAQGYEPAFTKMLAKSGIPRQKVICTHIYNTVPALVLIKKGTETTWKFNPERKQEIADAFRVKVNASKPTLIVVSDPATLGIFTGWDYRASSLDKCRGGVYDYHGIPVVITYPITAIHSHVDERLLKDNEGEDVKYEPYRVKQGAWVVARDWEKVGRFFQGKQRRIPAFVYSVCRTLEDCFAAKRFLDECVAIAADIETGCFPAQITCVGYCGLHKSGAVRSFVIPFYDEFKDDGVYWASAEDHLVAYSIMGDINDSPAIKIFQNGNYDNSYNIRDRVPVKNWYLDAMLMFYALFMELPKSLDFISSILMDNYQYWKDDIKGSEQKDEVGGNLERYWRYNALDCYNTMFNALYMMRIMNTNPAMQFNYQDVFMRATSVLAMNMRGVRADFKRLAEHREELQAEKDTAEARLRYLIDDPNFNCNSGPQKVQLLYDVLGARERNARGRFIDPNKPRKGTNTPSSGAIALKQVKTDHPIFAYVVTALEDTMVPDKQMGNITGRVGPDGKVVGGIKFFTDRLRTTYGATTVTTRLTSRGSAFWDGTNVQNIRDSMRDFAIADHGCILLDVDYSQSDDVFIGYESNDPGKIKLIESGLDGHAVHGELFFKRDYESIVAGKKAGDPQIVHPIYGIRQLSKKIVHGTNFQMAAMTLYLSQMGREATVAAAKYLGYMDAEKWPLERLLKLCDQLMTEYRRRYPRLTPKEWYGEIARQLLTTQTITNAFGVTRRFLGDPKDNGTQREATSFYGQSGTAGNVNRTMNEIVHGWMPKRFRDGDNPDYCLSDARKMTLDSHGFRLLLQTHDSFTAQISLDHKRWKEGVDNLLHVMNRPAIINGHTVRVRTEAAFGKRWGKKMIEWKGDHSNLDDIVSLAMSQP